MKKREHSVDGERRKRLCDLAHTNIRVHPNLITDGPFDQELFMATARAISRKVGPEQCLRDFLKALQLPNDDWPRLIPIHPSLAQSREPLMPVEEFIHVGCRQIEEIGFVPYFQYVLENLAQGSIRGM